MARRTFFSFHYRPDVHRAWNVRNSWVTKPDREDAGFFDSSVFESKERTNDEALKRFLAEGLQGTAVTAVLYGAETATRRWVHFELLKSFVEGKRILSVDIHSIKNLEQLPARPGIDPLTFLGVEVKAGIAKLKEYVDGTWRWAADVGNVSVSSLPYGLQEGSNKLFSHLFRTYDWATGDGRTNIGDWIEKAALAVGR
jgi:antiphage defense system Thoeris ThsB-like protein